MNKPQTTGQLLKPWQVWVIAIILPTLFYWPSFQWPQVTIIINPPMQSAKGDE